MSFVTLGGGGMCMLFEICEKRPFQKGMGWGGGVGGHSFAHRAVNGRTHRAQAMLQGSLIILNPTRCHKGRESIGAHIPLLVTGNILFQFFPILQPAWLHWHPPCVQLTLWTVKKGAGAKTEHNNLQSEWGCPNLEVVQLTLGARILHGCLVPQLECFHRPLGCFQ